MWDWWADLKSGVDAISYQEMTAWRDLTGYDPTGFEIGCIRALDSTYRRVAAEERDA